MSETAEIRKYLEKHYSDQSVSNLCQDHFPTVYNNFSIGMTKQGKIALLLDHCVRAGKLQDLQNLLDAREQDIGGFAKKKPLGVVLLAGVTLVLVVVAVFNIPWVKEQIMPPVAPTPTLFPITPVQADETLILIGSFDNRATNTPANVDVMRRTYNELVKLSQDNDLPGLRVEWVPEPIITTEQEAMDVGKNYGAKLVIWGWKDDAGAFIQGTRTDNDKPETIHGSEVHLFNQTTVPVCLSREVPSQGNYIALFTLGQGLIEWDNEPRIRLAMTFVDLALAEIEKRPISEECSAFNPWNGYGLQGHLYGTIALFLANENNLAEAITWRNKAIAAYNTSLDWKQDEVWILNGKGVSQSELANLLAQQGNTDDAIAMQQAAIVSYDAALQIAPDYAGVWYNKGYSQAELADLLAQQGNTDDAIAMRREAIASNDAALQIDPDYAGAWFTKGVSQNGLANLLAQQGNTDDAIAMQREAIASYDAALQIDPDYAKAWYGKGVSQYALADLLAQQGNTDDAIAMQREAIASYDAALQIDPDYAGAWYGKGNRQGALANLLAQQGNTDDAIAMWREAIASYDAALQVAPNYADAWFGKGYSQEQLAHLLVGQGEDEAALTLYRAAIASYDAALQVDPDYTLAIGNKEQLVQKLEQMGVEY